MRVEQVPVEVILPLRRAVLRPGQPAERSDYPTDSDAIHVAAISDLGVAVGIASLARDPYPGETETRLEEQWRLRGMATDESVRGSGVGALVLSYGIELARAEGAQLFWCNARTPAVGFYKRMGWVTVGEEFELPDIGPHYLMTFYR